MPDISPQDRDMMIRTVVGEADDQPAIGQAAVAHVIMNRTRSGRWGDTPSSVVLSRGQFEPWQTRAKELVSIKPESDRYRKTAAIVDDVLAGKVPDPTGGATHFLDPSIVRKRRGGSLPDWASGDGLQIGDHQFFRPAEMGRAMSPLEAIDAAIGAKPRKPGSSGAMAYDSEAGSLFRDAGFDVPGARPSAPAPAAPPAGDAAPAAKPGSLFESAGFTLPTRKAAPDEGTAGPGFVNTPLGKMPADASGKIIEPAAVPPEPSTAVSLLKRFNDAVEPFRSSNYVPFVGRKIGEAASAAATSAKEGIGDIMQGKSASGTGKAVMGTLGVLTSPLAGTANALGAGVTQLTGNPEAGERAALVAGGIIPTTKGAQLGVSAARNALPTSRAINELVAAVGPENAAAAVERLRANPRLTWADVSDPVRIRAQGLIDPAQPKAMEAITGAVKQRVAEGPGEVNYAYTKAMGPAPDVVQMVEGLKERARAVGREKIQPAIANAKSVDTTPVIAAIDNLVKPGLQAMLDPGSKLPLSPLQQELMRFKQQLVTPAGETLTDAQRLHEIQSHLGDYAFQLQGGSPKDRLLGSGLRDINEKLVTQIDKATNGAYRPARAAFKDAKDIHQAFDEGFDVLKNRSGVKGLEDRPEALAEWMKAATPEEVVAKRLGVRADIDQKIRGVKNQVLAGTNITKIEYNREKLAMLFGDKEASRLIRSMEDAGDVAKTNAKLVEGSKTAETLAGQKSMEVRKVGGGNPLQYATPVAVELLGQGAGMPGVGAAGVLALTGLHRGAQKVGQMSDLARNAAFARGALATGPAREETIRRVLSHPKVVRALKKGGNALTAPGVP